MLTLLSLDYICALDSTWEREFPQEALLFLMLMRSLYNSPHCSSKCYWKSPWASPQIYSHTRVLHSFVEIAWVLQSAGAEIEHDFIICSVCDLGHGTQPFWALDPLSSCDREKRKDIRLWLLASCPLHTHTHSSKQYRKWTRIFCLHNQLLGFVWIPQGERWRGILKKPGETRLHCLRKIWRGTGEPEGSK